MKGLHENNVRKIKDAPRPTTKKQVRSFYGLASFYREFCPNFAAITAPLTDLLKKGQLNQVKWEEPQERAFQAVRNLLCEKPVLRLPDPLKIYTMSTGASNEGIGAVLMQEHDGKFHPVSYASKKVCSTEENYSTVEKGCLAIVWGMRTFELYLQGVPFVFQIDNMPLSYIASAKFKNYRIMRLALFLQNFEMRLKPI